jgi:hypothetical protein
MSPPVFLSPVGSVHRVNSLPVQAPARPNPSPPRFIMLSPPRLATRRICAGPPSAIVLSRSPSSPLSPSSPPSADHRRGPWCHLPVSAGLSNDHGITSPSPLDLHDFGCRIIAIVSGGIGLVVASVFTWARLE